MVSFGTDMAMNVNLLTRVGRVFVCYLLVVVQIILRSVQKSRPHTFVYNFTLDFFFDLIFFIHLRLG